jgi:hypothetical protein
MFERADLLGHTESEHYLWPACQWGRFDATKPMLKNGTRPGEPFVTRRACTAYASMTCGTRLSPSWPSRITCSSRSPAICRAGCWSTIRTSGSTPSARRSTRWTCSEDVCCQRPATAATRLRRSLVLPAKPAASGWPRTGPPRRARSRRP